MFAFAAELLRRPYACRKRIGELDVTLEDSSLLTPAELHARLREIKALAEGWLNGEEGEPIDARGLDELENILEELNSEEELPLPYLYPTPEGLVQSEWTLDSWEVGAQFDLATGEVSLDAIHPPSGADKEATANFKTAAGRLALRKFVAGFTPKARI